MIPENCKRCGNCCQLVVRLSDDEIKRMCRLGYDLSFFLDKDFNGNSVIKMVNNYCVFLEIREGLAKCKIYKDRPKRCTDYPGKNICTLQKHFVFEEK